MSDNFYYYKLLFQLLIGQLVETTLCKKYHFTQYIVFQIYLTIFVDILNK